jgi:hypothetical protein
LNGDAIGPAQGIDFSSKRCYSCINNIHSNYVGGELNMANRFQSKWVMLIVGIAIGALAVWGFTSLWGMTSPSVTPYIVEGYSNGANYDGTTIGVTQEGGLPGEVYVIAGAKWREFGGPWHDSGTPPSLAQPNTGQKVRLGIVYVKPTQEALGGPVVAWIEVLSQ